MILCHGYWLRTELMTMRYHSEVSDKLLLTCTRQQYRLVFGNIWSKILAKAGIYLQCDDNTLNAQTFYLPDNPLIPVDSLYSKEEAMVYRPLSDSPLLLNLNLEWENKGDLKFS